MTTRDTAFPLYNYDATVLRVVDGDTLQVSADLGFSVHVVASIRLRGINAPELNTPEGRTAREFVVGLLPAGTTVRINTLKVDKFGGRFDAKVLLGDVDVASAVLAAGHAVPFMV
jgi:micrococcal nuclease